jgi:starch-binding outer membrane protein SusE/F
MKKIIIILLSFGIVFSSCIYKNEEGDPVIGVYKAPVMDDVSGNYVLTEETANDVFKTFTWTAADYGFPSATSYTVQIDFAGKNFATATDLLTTTNLNASITVGTLNQKLLAKGAKTNVPTDFEVRVLAKVSDYVDTLPSNAPVMKILPYKVVIIYPSLYLPGNYQAASGYGGDWSPALAQQIYSVKQNNKYEGYVDMVGSGIKFKFTDDPNWDMNWGDDGFNGTLERNGADIPVSAAGYYRIKADIPALTYSFLKTDWGLIGDATPGGWDTDTKMTYDNVSRTWKVKLDLKVGKVKFRANGNWDLNYGDTDFDGSLEEGGKDIPVDVAGNYTVTLNLEVAGYAYELKKN